MNAEHQAAETSRASPTTDAASQAVVTGSDPAQQSDRSPAVAEEQRIQQDIPWGVRIAAAWSWRVIVILIFAGVLTWLLSYISLLLISLMVAALLATLLKPVHLVLRRLRFPPVLAAMSSIVVLIAFVTGLLYLVGQEIIQGFAQMADQVEAGIYQLVDLVEQQAGQWGVSISTDQFNQWVGEAQTFLEDNADSILGGAAAIGSTAGNLVVGLILVLFTLIFFLADGRRIWDFLVYFVPGKHRPAVHGAGRRGWTSLGTYMRVQVFVAAVDAVGIGIGAAILGVPLALPVAVLVFLGGFIPIVGAVVTGAVAVLLALVANGFINALLMLGVVLAVQQLESNVLQPIVMGRAVKLHPLAVVLAVTAGTTLLGIVGALFAVPVLAFINRATRYLTKEEWRRDETALEMERRQTEDSVRKAVEREEVEAREQETLATMKQRLKHTLPVLDPDRPTFSRRGSDDGQDPDAGAGTPTDNASRSGRRSADSTDQDSTGQDGTGQAPGESR